VSVKAFAKNSLAVLHLATRPGNSDVSARHYAESRQSIAMLGKHELWFFDGGSILRATPRINAAAALESARSAENSARQIAPSSKPVLILAYSSSIKFNTVGSAPRLWTRDKNRIDYPLSGSKVRTACACVRRACTRAHCNLTINNIDTDGFRSAWLMYNVRAVHL